MRLTSYLQGIYPVFRSVPGLCTGKHILGIYTSTSIYVSSLLPTYIKRRAAAAAGAARAGRQAYILANKLI